MFTRMKQLISFVLIGSLLFQMACSKTVSTIYPKPHQDPNLPLPCEVEVKLKHKTLLNGIYRFRFILSNRTKKTTWQTDKISGKLVTWNDDLISIQTKDEKYVYEVQIEDIEKIEITKIEITESSNLYGCLGAYQGAVFLFVAGFLGGIRAYDDFNTVLAGAIGASFLGALLGGYLGAGADTQSGKDCVIAGTFIATVSVLAIAIFCLYAAAIGEAYHP